MSRINYLVKTIWTELVYGGHVFSLGAASIVFVSAILLKIPITIDCLIIVYLGIESTYLYNRYKELKIDALTNCERTAYLESYRKIIPYLIAIQILAIIAILILLHKVSIIPFSILMIIIGLSYSFFFKKYTKYIPGFKDAFVSFSWALLVFFLAFYYSYPINLSLVLLFLFIFFRLLIHEVFSDIKDVESDKRSGLQTLPIILSRDNLSFVINLLNLVAVFPLIFGILNRQFPIYSVVLIATIPYTLFCYQELEKGKINKNLLYNILVDGEYIFWTLFVLLGKFLIS